MSDLIERLECKSYDPDQDRLKREAAARIRELEAERDKLATGTIPKLVFRAVKAEAEREHWKKLYRSAWQDEKLELEAALAKAEAERNQFEGELRISQAAVGHNMGVAKRIETATIELCLSACMCEDCDRSIRALTPSCEGQSEKPVNPYLLGGSSTQSEG